jgi:TM2 domain-containing membrane protein YozV
MDAQKYLMMLPGLQPDELIIIQELSKDMTESQKQQFFMMYQNKRKDPQTLLLLTAIGFLGIAGIQRFIIGETGMGILYLITLGFCGIGTIIDMVNNKSMAYTFNRKMALESADMVKYLGR